MTVVGEEAVVVVEELREVEDAAEVHHVEDEAVDLAQRVDRRSSS